MLDSKTIRTRLAFIRYLYRLGTDQSRQPDPLRAASILTFHDAVELFLHLALEHSGVIVSGKKDIEFLEYWDKLAHANPPYHLSGKTSMARLNRARVSLKHHGLLPSSSDVDAFRSNVANFFEDNCSSVFGLEFNGVSMIDLVMSTRVRDHLARAERSAEQGNFDDAIVEVAVAFDVLVAEHEREAAPHFSDIVSYGRGYFGGPIFGFGDETVLNRDAALNEFAREVVDAVRGLRKGMRLIALGLDYPRYTKFLVLTPRINQSQGGTYEAIWWNRKPVSRAEYEFCRDFVIDNALRLQQGSALLAEDREGSPDEQ